jgi:hypothetical protein
MATDDPPRNVIPTFTQPPTPTPEASPGPPTLEQARGTRGAIRTEINRILWDRDGGGDGPTEPAAPRPDREPTRTAISSASKPSTKDTADLVVGLIALVAVAAGALVKWRLRRKLRTPDDTQSRNIAEPLARLALRHFDAAWLNKDLADLLQAGAATGAYINDGPLLQPLYPDDGVPPDLQEDQL